MATTDVQMPPVRADEQHSRVAAQYPQDHNTVFSRKHACLTLNLSLQDFVNLEVQGYKNLAQLEYRRMSARNMNQVLLALSHHV